MPEALKAQEVKSHTDPSVAKQWDNSTPKNEQFNDLYKITDSIKVGLLGTYRSGVGPVHRSMAIAKRKGPDFFFLANAHSNKFSDLESNQEVSLTFQNSSSMDWVSVTGTASVGGPGDPRVQEVWNRTGSAWFGDLGDGVHDGSANDPRMRVIEVEAKYISYWKAQVGTLGLMKEVVGALVTGDVPITGAQRQFLQAEIQEERSKNRD